MQQNQKLRRSKSRDIDEKLPDKTTGTHVMEKNRRKTLYEKALPNAINLEDRDLDK